MKAPVSTKIQHMLSLLVTAPLFLFMAFLLSSNYVSQRDLQKIAAERLLQDMEKRARTVSYFFAERRNDIKTLSESRAIAIFFENKALNMSMEYGLMASLLGISNHFKAFIDHKTFEGNPIYSRVVFITPDGKPLVDTAFGSDTQFQAVRWASFLARRDGPAVITGDLKGKEFTVFVSVPYIFKGRYSGQVLAFISAQQIYDHFSEPGANQSHAVDIIHSDHNFRITGESLGEAADLDLAALKKIPVGNIQKLASETPLNINHDLLAVRVPVNQTPFFLVKVLPSHLVYGSRSPFQLLIVMGILAVIVLGGALISWRFRMRHLILKAHLEEAGNREKEIERKNGELRNQIIERKRSEEALKTSEERFRRIFQAATVSIFEENFSEPYKAILHLKRKGVTDFKSYFALHHDFVKHCMALVKIIDINDAGLKLYGATGKDELFGSIESLMLPEALDNFRDLLIAIAEGKRYFEGESVNRTLSGENINIILSINIPPAEADFGNILVSIVDITRYRQAEQERNELQEKLARYKKMEALGLLAGGVAHDLNNILSGIVSYPELILLELPPGSPFQKSIQTIYDSGKRAAAIVQDLLTVARGIASPKEPKSLNVLIDEYLESPEHNALRDQHPLVTYGTDCARDLSNINCSSVHIKKTLMNLVNNATEAINTTGSVVISTENRYLNHPIRGYDHIHAGEYVVLRVIDNGSGIPPRDLDRIFEPFYTKKVMGRSGTGLGLAVVWNTVQDHNGYINVQSDAGGTQFELYFPVSKTQAARKASQIPMESYMGRGERILVVDDEPSQREIACAMLGRLGYHTAAAASGNDALEYLKIRSVDLVILDMIMHPVMNGRETYERILDIHPTQRAIIASGFSKTGEVEKAQQLGAGGYIKKPYTMERLGVAVRSELDRAGEPSGFGLGAPN
ncbi:ATP-binding protein [Desulfococcus sp.]|uniref:hybrid sensor histidine kinase/response regulator n=1 Tax=Desulfococcus sp. TaxID=2025834 RepID=UPI003592F14D